MGLLFMAKESFIIHLDSLNVLDKLNMQQRGEFITAIREYKATGETPKEFWLQLVLEPFINQFARDDKSYSEFSEKQRQKGLKSAESRRNKKQPRSTTVNHGKKTSTESTLSDSVSDNDSKSVSKSESDIVKLPFQSDRFLKAWNALLKEKNWKGKSQTALKLSLKTLSKYSEDIAIEMICKTIESGWKGIFPPKENNGQQQPEKRIYTPPSLYPEAT
jgi:hypothetical protein